IQLWSISAHRSSTWKMHVILRLLLAMVAAAAAFTNGDFFVRSAKWIPSGGAGLVSGRGNFRPGFTGRDWRSAIAEPNFRKRSVESWYSDEY
ncbi:hypothetical protein V3C99_009142, partial [Haemonchus contortus]|uniref:CAP10 domain-containing protein n=1 Tax=Haemonchus contortus TaxID=6289 RepID=A0A7I5EAL3_HAECO